MMKRRGATLVETMITMSIVFTLTGSAILSWDRSQLKAREAIAREELEAMRLAMEMMYLDTGLVMDQLGDLASTTPPAQGRIRYQMGQGWPTTPLDPTKWRGPYLKRPITVDPIFRSAYTWNSFNNGKSAIHISSTENGSNGIPYNQW